MRKVKKSGLYTKLYAAVLVLFTTFVLLDTFVIPRVYVVERDGGDDSAPTAAPDDADKSAENAVVTENSYSDGTVTVAITQYREYDTTIYVADVTLTSADALKTAFAEDTYGKNITETTSAIAEENEAVLAVNGDYYGARNSGYVIRNGRLYRQTVSDSDQEDLVIYADGSFEIVTEGSVTAEALLEKGAVQVLSFGPGLIENGELAVTAADEVNRAKASNPRTAIGIIGDLHYVFVVSDGRTNESSGLSLSALAAFMQRLGVQTAYNLDGGGSSTLVFNGVVVNNPTTSGKRIQERSVSDIVYIA